jgi:hypothetical protein
MGKMILRKRKDSSRKSALEILGKKRRSKGSDGQGNYKTTGQY